MNNIRTNWREQFVLSETGRDVKAELDRLMCDPGYMTNQTYWDVQGNVITFVEKHMNYLSEHPKTAIDGYLSNLRLMTKNRTA